jgi:hypothetical protein
MLTVSPAIGSYRLNVDIKIDSGSTGVYGDTGIFGEISPATLVDYWRDTGVTGINGADFNNMSDPNVVGPTYK